MDLTGRVLASSTLQGKDPPCSQRALADIQRALSEVAKGNGSVYLNSSALGDAGLVQLLTGLGSGSCVRSLNLISNSISDRGASRLAAAIAGFPYLEVLTLAQNQIGDEGAMQLATAMEAHRSLRVLSLDGNLIADAGTSALITALVTCRQRGGNCTLTGNPTKRLDEPGLSQVQDAAATVQALSGVGVTLGQLLPLFQELVSSGKIDPWKTTTGEAIQDVILPMTCNRALSYVEFLNCSNAAPTVHVIHAWTGLFQDLLKNIAMHASGKAEPSLDPNDDLWRFDPEFLEKSYFVDAFCCNQHSSTNRVRRFGLTDSAAFPMGDTRCQVDKLDLVAEQIRRRGGNVLVCVDSKTQVLKRFACLMELRKALLDGMPVEASFISIQEARGSLTSKATACSEKAALEAMEQIAVGPGGVDGFNQEIVSFINEQVAIKWKEKVEGKRR